MERTHEETYKSSRCRVSQLNQKVFEISENSMIDGKAGISFRPFPLRVISDCCSFRFYASHRTILPETDEPHFFIEWKPIGLRKRHHPTKIVNKFSLQKYLKKMNILRAQLLDASFLRYENGGSCQKLLFIGFCNSDFTKAYAVIFKCFSVHYDPENSSGIDHIHLQLKWFITHHTRGDGFTCLQPSTPFATFSKLISLRLSLESNQIKQNKYMLTLSGTIQRQQHHANQERQNLHSSARCLVFLSRKNMNHRTSRMDYQETLLKGCVIASSFVFDTLNPFQKHNKQPVCLQCKPTMDILESGFDRIAFYALSADQSKALLVTLALIETVHSRKHLLIVWTTRQNSEGTHIEEFLGAKLTFVSTAQPNELSGELSKKDFCIASIRDVTTHLESFLPNSPHESPCEISSKLYHVIRDCGDIALTRTQSSYSARATTLIQAKMAVFQVEVILKRKDSRLHIQNFAIRPVELPKLQNNASSVVLSRSVSAQSRRLITRESSIIHPSGARSHMLEGWVFQRRTHSKPSRWMKSAAKVEQDISETSTPTKCKESQVSDPMNPAHAECRKLEKSSKFDFEHAVQNLGDQFRFGLHILTKEEKASRKVLKLWFLFSITRESIHDAERSERSAARRKFMEDMQSVLHKPFALNRNATEKVQSHIEPHVFDKDKQGPTQPEPQATVDLTLALKEICDQESTQRVKIDLEEAIAIGKMEGKHSIRMLLMRDFP